MKRFVTTHLSPLFAAAFLVATLPAIASANEVATPEECTDALAAQMECEPDHTITVREEVNEDGDLETELLTCDLSGASTSIEIVIDSDGVSVDFILTCDYGNCGPVDYMTSVM